jgi:hypothetical protein
MLSTFIFGAIPALAILVDEPIATATPWVQEPPQPPQLSDEEQKAADDKNVDKNYDKEAFKRAEEKRKTVEKFSDERNQQKRDNNRRGGGRRR